MRTPRLLPPLLVLAAAALHALPAAASTPEIDAAWESLSKLFVAEAHDRFQAAYEALPPGPQRREAAYGFAAALLNDPPTTDEKIDRARSLFTEVAAVGDDDLGLLARYFLARIEHVHRARPDLARAEELYRQLYQQHSDHSVAQLAIVKVAILRLRGPRLDADEARRRVGEFVLLLPHLSDTTARRNMHLVIAGTYTREISDRAAALDHLIAADELVIPSPQIRAHNRSQIFFAARATGRTDIAIRYGRLFAREHPRDNRTYYITELTRELERLAER